MSRKLTDDHIVELGTVVVAWSMLEASLDHAIAVAAGLSDEAGKIFTTQVFDVQKRTTILRSLVNENWRDDGLNNELAVIAARIVGDQGIQQKRNRLMHGLWNPSEATLKRFVRGAKLTEVEAPETVESIRVVGVEILDVGELLLDFVRDRLRRKRS